MKTLRLPFLPCLAAVPALTAASLILVAALLAAPTARAQEVVPPPEARPSPLALAQITLDDGTYVKIHYSSPRMRDRQIFGALVPFGSVWRLGANEATEMTTTGPIRFGGEELKAGTYALFAIPERTKWTIIVNGNLGQWGAFSYSEDADVLRIEVPSDESDKIFEAFTMGLEKNENRPGARLIINWERTTLSVPIEPVTS